MVGADEAEAGNTVTVVLAVAEPPAPVQVIPKIVVVAGLTTPVPEVEVAVVQPPIALQILALVDVQERVVVAQAKIGFGLAVNITVGSSGPPPPPQAAEEVTVTVFELTEAPALFTACTT